MKNFLCGLVVLLVGFGGGLFATRFEPVRNVVCPCEKCTCCPACPGQKCSCPK